MGAIGYAIGPNNNFSSRLFMQDCTSFYNVAQWRTQDFSMGGVSDVTS